MQRMITLPFERAVHPTCRQLITLLVDYEPCLVPIGGSDFYGEQHLAVDISDCRIHEVNGARLWQRGLTRAALRGHRIASEFFIWEEHANEIACRVIEQHLRGGE